MGILPIQLLELAREKLELGRPREALKLLRSPVPEIFSAEKKFLIAEGLRSQGYFVRCEPCYRQVLSLVNPRQDASLWLEACLGLISVKRSLGEIKAARKLVKRAGPFARRPEDKRRLELEDALIDRAAGLHQRSLGRLNRFLRLFQSEKDWAGVGFILWAIGGARRFQGNLKSSELAFLESLAAFKRARDASGKAYALFGLGGITRIRGKLKQSKAYYEEAWRLLDRTQDIFGQAYAQCGLANALRQLGECANAERHYLRSRRLYSQLGDAVDLAYVDWGLGKLALQKGNFTVAESRLWKALLAFRKGGETRGIVLSEAALASLFHACGRTAWAESLFEKNWRRARKAGLHAHLEIYT